MLSHWWEQDHAVKELVFPLERRIKDIPDKGTYDCLHDRHPLL